MTRSRQGNGRSTIYRGGDGRWRGRVTVGLTDQGRTDRRHVDSTSKSKVVERVKALEQARDRGQLSNLSKPWTVESWLEYWLENVSRPFVKQSTYEGYRAAVRVHLIPGIGRHSLALLRPEHRAAVRRNAQDPNAARYLDPSGSRPSGASDHSNRTQ